MTFDLVAIASSSRTRIREIWCGLEAVSRPSYFLTWGWVETWLDALPASAPITLYVARRAGAPIAAFFLGARTQWRHRVLRSRALHLNQTGFGDYDEICIEYNGMVHDGSPPPFTEIAALLPGGWDEIVLTALDADGPVARALLERTLGRGATRRRIARAVRKAGDMRGGVVGRALFAGGWLAGGFDPATD